MIIESKTKLGYRRVVVQEKEFGFFTIEVGALANKTFKSHEQFVPVIGFAWPGWAPQFHVLN